MSLYTGYAQQKGFDPIEIVGLEEKIRQQGKEEYAAREEAIAWNNQEAKRTAEHLDREAKLDLESREVNHKLRQNFAEVLAENEWRNFERGIAAAKKSSTFREDDLKSLLSLTKTGTAIIQEWNQKREKDATSFARHLRDQYGFGADDLATFKSIDRGVFNYSMRNEGHIQGFDHIDAETAWRIRRSGGYLELKVNELAAQRLAGTFSTIYAENRTKEYELTGDDDNPVMVSIATANAEQIDEVLRLVERDAREEAEAEGKYWPDSKIWETSGAYKIAEAARVEQRKEIDAEERAEGLEQAYDEVLETLEHQMKRPNDIGDKSGVVGINSAVMFYAGGPDAPRQNIVQARKKVVDALIYGLNTDRFSWTELNLKDLETLELNVRGQKAPVQWGSYFRSEWSRIEAAGKENVNREYEQALRGEREHKIAELDFLEQVQEITSSGEDNIETLTKLLGVAQNNNFTKPANHLTKVIAWGKEEINDKVAAAHLLARRERNEIITPDEIDLLHMSAAASAQAKAMAVKYNTYLPQTGKDGTADRLKERIDRELQIIIPKQNSWSSNASHKDASLAAFEKASGYYRAYREAGKGHEDSYLYARDMITKDIRDKDGDWGAVSSNGIKEFRGYQANTARTRIVNATPKIREELTSDPNLIYTRAYIAKEQLLRKSARLNKNLSTPILERAELIRSVTGGAVQPIDAEVAQIEYWRNLDIAETGSTDLQQYPEWYIKKARETEKLMSPKAQRLLSDYNYSKINQASLESGNGIIYQKPVIDKAQITGKKLSGGNYNSIGGEVDSTNKLGFSLTGSTIREVMILMEGGRFETAGAYSLDYNMLDTAAKEAGLSLENHFTPDVQDDLFEILFKSGKWKPNEELLEEDEKLFFIESSANLNNDKIDKKYGFHNPMLVNIKARKALLEMGRYA